MKFYRFLYIGDTVTNPSKIKWKIKCHAGVQVYIIAISGGADQLEIMHAAYLKQKYFRKHPPIIVGLASDYDEAIEIITQITKECLEITGNCNLKEYLKLRVKQKRNFNGANT